MPTQLRTPIERFEARVQRGPLPSDCWRWTGQVMPSGYSQFWPAGHTNGKQYGHIFSYVLAYGAIPQAHVIDHLCHTLDSGCPGGPLCKHRQCCNPLHLEAVTQLVNNRRSQHWRQDAAGSWFCGRGHRIVKEQATGCPACAAANKTYRPNRASASGGNKARAKENVAQAEARMRLLALEHPTLVAEAESIGLQTVRRRLAVGWQYDREGWISGRWGRVPFGVAEPRSIM